MPRLEPARAGFTKTGRPRPATVSVQTVGLASHAPGRSTANRPMGRPCAANSSFMTCLSMPTAEASTPAPTYGRSIRSRAPWRVPSSPYGPCKSGSTTSTRPRERIAPSASTTRSSRSSASRGSTTCTGSSALETPSPPDAARRSGASWAPSTLVVTAGRPARRQGAPLNPPVVLSSTYVSAGVPGPGDRVYGRYDNETWDAFEEALAALEGSTRPAFVFASGMAAVAAVMSLVPHGGRIVMPRHTYQVALQHAHELTRRSAIT